MKTNRRLFTGFVLLAAITVACTCPVSLFGLNPLKGIEKTGMAIASQMPEGLAETFQVLVTESAPEGFAQTAEAGIATFVPQGTGKAPDNIPIMEGKVDMQLATPETVTYSVNKSAEDIKKFYQDQMPAYGWKLVEDGGLDMAGMVNLRFENEESHADVNVIGVGDSAQVLISIKPK